MGDEKIIEDFQLVQAYKTGDNIAIARLMEKYSDLLFGYGFRLLKNADDVKDCIQNLAYFFISAPIDKRQSYFNEGPNAIKGYLFRALYNKAIDELRRNNRGKVIDRIWSLYASQTTDIESKEIQEEIEFHEIIVALKDAVKKLEPEDQRFVELTLMYPRSKQKIMTELNISENQYKTIQRRVKLLLAREKLISDKWKQSNK